jgi:hypothetical protein
MAITTSEKQDTVDSQTKREHEKYKHLLEQAKTLAPLPTAVAHPCDESLVRKGVKLLSAILPTLVWQVHCNSSWRTVTWFKSEIKCP